MGEQEYYYKVVSEDLKSCMVDEIPEFCKDYSVGSLVEADPDILGLMVFESLEDAVEFIGEVPASYRIVKVKCFGEYHRPVVVVDFCLLSVMEMKFSLEDYYGIKTSRHFTRKPPLGTVCFPAVQVIEEVEGWR